MNWDRFQLPVDEYDAACDGCEVEDCQHPCEAWIKRHSHSSDNDPYFFYNEAEREKAAEVVLEKTLDREGKEE